MSTMEITTENFEQVVDGHDIVVLDATAEWCGPCRTFAPVYEAASTRHPDVLWGKLDTEDHPDVAAAFEIRAVPTLMVFREGILVFQQAGMLPADALDILVGEVKKLDMEDVREQLEEQNRA
jgi:thioredoxin 1